MAAAERPLTAGQANEIYTKVMAARICGQPD
jgi:hypothetical protein